MLTYRVGAGGQGGNAAGMANYYLSSEHMPQMQSTMADYYVGKTSSAQDGALAVPNQDMHKVIAERLEIDPTRPVTVGELTNLFNGKTTTGKDIEGKKESRNSYIDMTFSAPKSFSVALVMAPTRHEKEVLDKAFRDAITSIMDHISKEIGTASVGDNTGNKDRSRKREPAHIAYIQVDHYTARPIIKEAEGDDTKLTPAQRGDPQRHAHILVPNVAVTNSGRATSLHQDGLRQRIHEWGSLFQAHLAQNLRSKGVNVELDSAPNLSMNERMARLTDVPRWVDEMYSKRTNKGEEKAREMASKDGLDFDDLSPHDKAHLLGKAVNAGRRKKDDDGAEYASWLQQAKDAGYRHRSVLRPGQEVTPGSAIERHQKAYSVALPLIDEQFAKRAVLEGSVPRVAAAKGLIAAGIVSASEVNKITAGMRTEGVLQDRTWTSLHWAYDPQAKFARVTTQLSVDMENEAIGILRDAAADKSVALTKAEIDSSVARVSKRDKLDFTTEHGKKQLEFLEKIGTSGRAIVAIGVAGSGKSASLLPLVDAWQERKRDVYGITLAWRQTEGLKDAGIGRRGKWTANDDVVREAGIEREKTFALDPFLRGLSKGRIKLDRNSTVVIDEVALLGTRQVLELARYQKKLGFHIVGIGDDMQCQSVSAGSTVDLARRAFGSENVPELLETTRQLTPGDADKTKRDRETAMMWRDGNAAGALARKEEDGTLKLVPGGYDDAIKAVVDLWWERREANKGKNNYTLGISAPTNADTRAIGLAIRERRQAAGEIGQNLIAINATDQNGDAYTMRLAAGDRVRLYHRVRGHNADGKDGIVGNNGSVVDVVTATKQDLTVRKPNGKIAIIPWGNLRLEGGPIRLGYGDAVTIDARQSDTVTEHITAMPSGSAGVNGFKAYTTESRHRWIAWLVTSHGAEKEEVRNRRPLGDQREIDRDAIIENMAKNMSQQPKKTLAVNFLDNSINLKSGTVNAQHASWHKEHAPDTVIEPVIEQPIERTIVEVRQEIIAETVQESVIEPVVADIEDYQQVPLVPEKTIEEAAKLIVDGQMEFGDAVEYLMAHWERDNPLPPKEEWQKAADELMVWHEAGEFIENGKKVRKEAHWEWTGDDPLEAWDKRQQDAEMEVSDKLDELVDSLENETAEPAEQMEPDLDPPEFDENYYREQEQAADQDMER